MKIDGEKLKKLIKEHPDWTLDKLAKELNVTTAAVHYYIKTKNINYKSKNPAIDIERLKKLIKEHPDWTLDKLAKELNVTKAGVHYYIKVKNINYKSKNPGY
ncbi:hypothetical protein INTERNEXUS_144 [Bacillus phage vB_BspM_Internexus]|nr:hypothetical protein INTERNEXUS_144 [Bacillus phage vB_BspM_Internexus]